MSIKERKAREKQALQEKIFNAALELIQEEGVDAFSIRKLATKIEYSTRTIYLYYQNKFDIFHQIIDKAFAATLEKYKVIDKMRKENNARDILYTKVALHMETALENPIFYQSVIKIIQSNEFVIGKNQKAVMESIKMDIYNYSNGKYEEDELNIRTQLSTMHLQSASLMLIQNTKLHKNPDMFIQMISDSIFDGIIN